MNVYIMYKFTDYEKIKDSIVKLEETEGINVFYFSPSVKTFERWKGKARKKIKEADVVCYFFNCETVQKRTRNLNWEYKFAIKNNKKIIIIDDDNKDDIINELLKSKKNGFVKKLFNYAYNDRDILTKPLSFKQSKEKLDEQSSWKIEDKLLIEDESDIEKDAKSGYYSLLMEQYKIMVDTSEKLMERRQATSNLYTTVCTTLVALVGSAFALKNMFALSSIFMCVGVVIILLAVNWKLSLDSYNRNNEGKFAVLNEIEKKLPANMFDSEYRYNKLNGIKSFALRERMLPSIFMVLGAVFILCSLTFLILKFCKIDFFII